MRFHHVGMVLKSKGHAQETAERLFAEPGPLRWWRVDAFDCVCAFSEAVPEIEFVVPDPQSLLSGWIAASPTRLHHIALAVPDIMDCGLPLLFPKPAQGAGALIVNFAKSVQYGLLLELVQEPGLLAPAEEWTADEETAIERAHDDAKKHAGEEPFA